jgi:hypothetical protein
MLCSNLSQDVGDLPKLPSLNITFSQEPLLGTNDLPRYCTRI